MKKILKLLTLSAVAFGLTFWTNPLCAGQGSGHDGHMIGPCGDGECPFMMMDYDLLKQVGLTAEQKAKIDVLNSEHQKADIKQQSEIKILRVDIKTEMDKDMIDMAKIGELADKIGKAQADLMKMNITHAAQVEAIMTKEQRAKLDQLQSEHRLIMMERGKGKAGRDAMKEKK
jgi:Spy/CpxP family protein refolding chaperone